MARNDIDEIVKESIRRAELRHKERIRDIALGIGGRHKNLIEFCRKMTHHLLEDRQLDYNYMIYFPQLPRASTEIISVISEKKDEFDLIPPISHKGVFDRIKRLDSLFSSTEGKCSECDMISDNCRFYFNSFRFSKILGGAEDASIIGDLLSEIIEVDKLTKTYYVFIKRFQIPPHRILSASPGSQIYNGIFILIASNESAFDDRQEMCKIIQKSYRLLMNEVEKGLISCVLEGVVPTETLEKRNSLTKASKSYPPKEHYDPSNPPGTLDNRIFIGGNYDHMALLKEMCETVCGLDYQPIFAYDFRIPEEEIHDYDTRLLHMCKYAIFEVTDPEGALMEIEKTKDYSVETLLIYQIRDKSKPVPPPRLTSMLKTFHNEKMSIKGYSSIDEMRDTIISWIRNR